jgi:hypothetical protein
LAEFRGISAMARNEAQFQESLSEAAIEAQYGTE